VSALKAARGMRLYAEMVARIWRCPMTAAEISFELQMRTWSVLQVLRRLHHAKLVHACAWKRESAKGPLAPVFTFGSAADVEHPSGPRRGSIAAHWSTAPKPHIELLAFVQAVRSLREPIAVKDLCDAVGAAEGPIGRLVRHMRELGMVRIAAWDQAPARVPIALYALGTMRDAPRPKRQDRADIARAYRARRSALVRARRLSQALVTGKRVPLVNSVFALGGNSQ
jgi:hypothetical protein